MAYMIKPYPILIQFTGLVAAKNDEKAQNKAETRPNRLNPCDSKVTQTMIDLD